jgi:16S rRNA (uracil1498-N3)-methyltransferase
MNTFFGSIQDKGAILNEDESLHCVKVLRHKVGDTIRVIDGKGTIATGKIVLAHAKQCAVAVTDIKKFNNPRSYRLHLVVAPTKNMDRIEWFTEKAVEVGIDEISFIKTKNSERTVVKIERIHKVAESALKQSQQAFLPIIREIIDYKEFLQIPNEDIKLIAHCEKEEKKNLKDYLGKANRYTILIGPEGDFTNDEIQMAIKSNYLPLSLGDSRLRTETAALFSVMGMAILHS